VNSVIKAAQEAVEVWERQRGRVFESMGRDNPRVGAIEFALNNLKASIKSQSRDPAKEESTDDPDEEIFKMQMEMQNSRSEQVCSTCGKVDNIVCSNAFHLKEQSAVPRTIDECCGEPEGTFAKFCQEHPDMDRYIAERQFEEHVARKSQPSIPAPVLEVLKSTAAVFREYEQLHRAKRTEEGDRKALANAAHAQRIEDVLKTLST
jgi:hypothetical protein